MLFLFLKIVGMIVCKGFLFFLSLLGWFFLRIKLVLWLWKMRLYFLEYFLVLNEWKFEKIKEIVFLFLFAVDIKMVFFGFLLKYWMLFLFISLLRDICWVIFFRKVEFKKKCFLMWENLGFLIKVFLVVYVSFVIFVFKCILLVEYGECFWML